jgi:DNA processing protein
MMTSYPIEPLALPERIREIADPPKQLTIRGTFPDDTRYFLSVVGSREYTPYGQQACERIIRGLRGYPVVIVSGLALGIDGIAHRTALDVGIPTIAVPGSGLDDAVLYPATHRKLARDILDAGGALVSEFEPRWRPRPESFPQRNRIMAGMSHAVLVIEATIRSGTLITARLASEYCRDVLAVPGPIHSATSAGPHMLIQKGAYLVTSAKDVLTALGIDTTETATDISSTASSPEERQVLSLLSKPMPRDELIHALALPISDANVLLASLEIKGIIEERLGMVQCCSK